MDWQQLRYFLAVAAAGSLAGAARRLGVSKATAWRQVHALEQSLGVRLLERHANGYVLTGVGQRFLASVEGVGRTIEVACRTIAAEPALVEGEVRVTAPELIGVVIARQLPALAARHPGLALEMITGSPAAGLAARDTDIALRVERPFGSGFVNAGTFPIRFGVFAAPTYVQRFGVPRTIGDFAGHRLIDFEHSLAQLAPEPWRERGGRGATITFRSNSPHLRLAAARAGLGLALLAEIFVADEPGLRPVIGSDQVGSLELLLLVGAHVQNEPRVAAAREFLTETLAKATAASPSANKPPST
jgi:molybdate transport repressor ModE-like protein